MALALSILVPAVIGVYFYARLDRTLSDLDIALIDFARISSSCIIFTGVFYAKNAMLRGHITKIVSDFVGVE